MAAGERLEIEADEKDVPKLRKLAQRRGAVVADEAGLPGGRRLLRLQKV